MCVSKPRLLLTCEDKVINKGKVDLMNILSVTHLCNLSRTILAPFFFLEAFYGKLLTAEATGEATI